MLRSFLNFKKGARARRRAVQPLMCGALVFVAPHFFVCSLFVRWAVGILLFNVCAFVVASRFLRRSENHSRRIPSNVALECATLRECCLGEGICAQGADRRKSNEKASERMDGGKRTPDSIQYTIINCFLKRMIKDLKAKNARHRIWLCVLARSLGGGEVNSQTYVIYKEFLGFAGDALRVLVDCLRSRGVFLGALGVGPGSARVCSLVAPRAANINPLGIQKVGQPQRT